jgi:hypothetical protein
MAGAYRGFTFSSSYVIRSRAEQLEMDEAKKLQIVPSSFIFLGDLFDEVYTMLRPRKKDYEAQQILIAFFDKFAKLNIWGGGQINGVEPVLRAIVPVVKFVDCRTGIECDISIENKDGILRSELIHIFSSIDERFKKLCYLMKAWAKVHNINNSRNGTLNSLSIILLVAFHLQLEVAFQRWRDECSPTSSLVILIKKLFLSCSSLSCASYYRLSLFGSKGYVQVLTKDVGFPKCSITKMTA